MVGMKCIRHRDRKERQTTLVSVQRSLTARGPAKVVRSTPLSRWLSTVLHTVGCLFLVHYVLLLIVRLGCLFLQKKQSQAM